MTELSFDVTRAEVEGKVTSTARLLLSNEVLCVGEVDAVVIPLDRLTGFAFGSRRSTAATS